MSFNEWTTGQVESYDRISGTGVLKSDKTPGGCFVHFSAIEFERQDGYREVETGETVRFSYEQREQDGYQYSALVVLRNSAKDEQPS